MKILAQKMLANFLIISKCAKIFLPHTQKEGERDEQRVR